MARPNLKCEHLTGVQLSKIPHPYIGLMQFGTKTRILICMLCYEKLKHGERAIIITKSASRIRYMRIPPDQQDELFPEILVDLV